MNKKKGYQIPERDILYEIVIEDYPSRIEMSKKRRAKYYHKNAKNLPKKCATWLPDKKGYLIDPKTGERGIKNSKSINKPRYYNISGQDLWSFNIHPSTRVKVSQQLKKFYYNVCNSVIDNSILSFPIGVALEFYGDPDKEEDLDNLERWHKKCILDALCGNVEYIKNIDGKKVWYTPDRENYKQFIKDDSPIHITEVPSKFVADENRRRLVIKIYTT